MDRNTTDPLRVGQEIGSIPQHLPDRPHNLPLRAGQELGSIPSRLQDHTPHNLPLRAGEDIGLATSSLLGLVKSSLFPSINLHGGLALITYGIARSVDRVELKDYLWPTGMVANAWYTAVGQHMLGSPRVNLGGAFSRLNYNQIVLLGGATAWGARLAYRIVTRSLRRGKDDARYEGVKETKGFWNQALFSVFLPEAVFQALITLPFTMPFRPEVASSLTGASPEWARVFRLAATAVFAFGFTMETLADKHLETHKRNIEGQGHSSMCRDGVWSIVRHPNYLGDALCHLAFPLWNYGSGLYNPWQLLGPVANYLFLRGIGGDKCVLQSTETEDLG